MSTTLSLLTPSGRLTLGSYLGALLPMTRAQDSADQGAYYGVSDLHALTTDHDPARLRELSLEQQQLFVALGLDRATLFRQSQVPAHAQLAYLLECVASTGELNRMIQFKEKGRGVDSTRVSLYTYPVLMAADILLYRPTTVPVGDDQRQHVELTRDLALRFNHRYGEVFTVPDVAVPVTGARVRSLTDPRRKMSKSDADTQGTIYLLDPPDVVRRKVARAVTDSDVGPGAVRVDAERKPGVTNLLEILAACGGSADGITTYGALKSATADAVVSVLEPIQAAYAALDPDEVTERFEAGEERCREVTEPVLAAARTAIGL
jgi:tryptophanyl-tRNA synthetase